MAGAEPAEITTGPAKVTQPPRPRIGLLHRRAGRLGGVIFWAMIGQCRSFTMGSVLWRALASIMFPDGSLIVGDGEGPAGCHARHASSLFGLLFDLFGLLCHQERSPDHKLTTLVPSLNSFSSKVPEHFFSILTFSHILICR